MAENTHCFLFHCLLYFNLSFMCICREKPLSHPCLRLDIPSILFPPSLRDATLNLPFHPPISLHIPLVNILRFLIFFSLYYLKLFANVTVKVAYLHHTWLKSETRGLQNFHLETQIYETLKIEVWAEGL